MDEFKGTPGPWCINRHGAVVGGAFHQYANGSAQSQVAMATGTREINEGEMRANALLIAAAPELLEALLGVLKVADRATDEFDAARAAIKKALGQ